LALEVLRDGGVAAVDATSADTWEVWGEAVRLAATFWRRAGALESLSPGMKVIALRNFEALDRMPTYELRKR
jgi:hypothetical protein